jgi:hypothetical protein
MPEPEPKVAKYLDGLSNPEAFQKRSDIKPGDPQFVALNQYIAGKTNLKETEAVLDIGAGGGVLAHVIDEVWTTGAWCPHYVAVDLPEPLDSLSLPTRVHNNSRKVPMNQFYESELETLKDKVSLVVIRNVLHELSIEETASLLFALLANLRPDAEIYIQDMATLPRLERNRAGWDSKIIESQLNKVGFQVSGIHQSSHTGTKWFSLIAKVRDQKFGKNEISTALVDGRKEQLQRIHARLEENIENAEYVQLINDSSAITHLLSKTTPLEEPAKYPLEEIGICTRPLQSFGANDFAVISKSELYTASGLKAALSRKSLIDFPAQLARCTSRAYFSGLSLRKFFTDTKSEDLCGRLVYEYKGCVRLLMLSPDSPFATLRSSEPAYGDNSEVFFEELNESLVAAKAFVNRLTEKFGKATPESFDIRISRRAMYASYVIIDDIAFVSRYSSLTTGSAGVCMIYEGGKHAKGEFRVIEGDMEAAWNHAASIIYS